MSLLHTGAGLGCLLVGGVLEGVGLWWALRIVRGAEAAMSAEVVHRLGVALCVVVAVWALARCPGCGAAGAEDAKAVEGRAGRGHGPLGVGGRPWSRLPAGGAWSCAVS